LRVRRLHSWSLSYEEARRLQEKLRNRLSTEPLAPRARFIAGTDVSYEIHGDTFFAGVVVWDMEKRELIEEKGYVGHVTFPYIPGLLSFREAPVLLKAFQKIRSPVDVMIVDGQGIAHPRGLGIAAHISLLLDIPGAGCAKSRLIGEHAEVGGKRGNRADLLINGVRVGVALRTRDGVKPVFVSPGHRITVDAAANLVMKCTTKYRIPEPTRLAHHFVNRMRREAGKCP